jgi:hypothetical protein
MANLIGESDTSNGVEGRSNAVFGTDQGVGVLGECDRNIGVKGVAATGTGVNGVSKSGFGVAGESDTSLGVIGISNTGHGVEGRSNNGPGIFGKGTTGGLFEGSQVGITATGGGDARNLAGFFNGNVEVVQTIKTFDVVILGSDCAEDFDITLSSVDIEPGTVMVIGEDARLVESYRAYDKRVAGVVSGAGSYKPGIVLGRDTPRTDRVPLALVGKVFCKADATHAPIEVGDLLTTSDTEGHAMKADDSSKAFGTVVGKALAPLREGRGLLPILVALQ